MNALFISSVTCWLDIYHVLVCLLLISHKKMSWNVPLHKGYINSHHKRRFPSTLRVQWAADILLSQAPKAFVLIRPTGVCLSGAPPMPRTSNGSRKEKIQCIAVMAEGRRVPETAHLGPLIVPSRWEDASGRHGRPTITSWRCGELPRGHCTW